ncbi:hypothetical protein N665_0152s0033 [Sinapis alba]|nr:hypothetical protein N665_0152s0033 [Sinapis alba]
METTSTTTNQTDRKHVLSQIKKPTYFYGYETKTPGGLPIEDGISWYQKSDYFKNRPSTWFYSYTSPDEFMLGSDLKQNLYCHFLCGLVKRDEVTRIGSTFCSGVVRVIKKLWPQTLYIEAVVTGSMAQYVHTLKHYCGDMPLFIPTEGGNDDVVDLADVKLGCSYQLLVTNLWRLYRMRIRDIVKVTGFHNKAPKFRVLGRENTLLSIDTDRTTEEYLLKAVNRARLFLESSDLKLVSFTSYTDISSSPVKAKEKDMKDLDEKTLLECCLVMEDTFDEEYMYCRASLEIRIVNDGTFDSLMNLSISKGASITQYKTSICITSEEGLQVLETNVYVQKLTKGVNKSDLPYTVI